MSQTSSAIDAFLAEQGQAVVDWQRELVSRVALGPDNGGKGEADKVAFIKDELAKLGIEPLREMASPDSRVDGGRPNLAALVPGRDSNRTLWIIAHTDVVPAGDPGLWSSDPYQLAVDGDTITGRGVEDNNQAIVTALLTAKALTELDMAPAMNLGLIFAADEETGNRHGLDFVMREHADLFGDNDLFLVPDFGHPESKLIEVAEKSMMWLKVTVTGKQCHASTPQAGRNSLVACADLIIKLRGLSQRFDRRDDLFDPPVSTFEPTKKEANVENVNTVPGRDVFYVDCRVLAEYSLSDVQEAVREMARDVARSHEVEIAVDAVHEEQAAPATSVDSEIVHMLRDAVREVYGVTPSPVGIGGGTVAAFLRKKGFEAAVWSTIMHNAHQPNEHALISNHLRDAKVVARLLAPSPRTSR
jgi:succinyl-diaminopimelate desuccinylase